MLPEFFRLLRHAAQASLNVDFFDLRSEDPASVTRWHALLGTQRSAVKELIEFCRAHGGTVEAEIGQGFGGVPAGKDALK